MQRVSELRKAGMWSQRRLPKCMDPPRNKSRWDYLLEEMQWMAVDFAQERLWKTAMAKEVYNYLINDLFFCRPAAVKSGMTNEVYFIIDLFRSGGEDCQS